MSNQTLLPLASQNLPSIVTTRLNVRMARAEDLEAIVRYVTENAVFLQTWEPIRTSAYYTATYWRQQITRDAEDFHADRGVRFFLFDSDAPGASVRGAASFGNVVRGAAQYCTLGYAMAASAEGQGLMREALAEAAIPFVFQKMGLHRIHANYIPRNERSGGLLRRLGFTVEGYARDYLYINGRWEDHILTGLSNADWKPPSV